MMVFILLGAWGTSRKISLPPILPVEYLHDVFGVVHEPIGQQLDTF